MNRFNQKNQFLHNIKFEITYSEAPFILFSCCWRSLNINKSEIGRKMTILDEEIKNALDLILRRRLTYPTMTDPKTLFPTLKIM